MASNGSNGGVPPRGRPPPQQQNVQQAGPALAPQQNVQQARPAPAQQNVQQQLNPLFQGAGAHANIALAWLMEDVPEPRRNRAESVIWPELHSPDDQDADG